MNRCAALQITAWIVALSGFSYSALAFADDGPNALPRYRLQVGQEIAYKGSSEFEYGNGDQTQKMRHTADWKLWVANKNDDGSYRVIVQFTRATLSEGDEPRNPQTQLGFCDVFDDGRIAANPSLSVRLDPSSLFPKLAESGDQINQGWEHERGADDGRSIFRVLSQPDADKAVWSIEEVRKSPMDEIYLSTHKSTVSFDAKQGLVAKIESENSQGYGFNGKGTGTVELVSAEMGNPEATKQLRDQATRYFEVEAAYDAKVRQASKNAARCEQLLSEAEELLKSAQSDVTAPVLQQALNNQLERHEQAASYYAESAAQREKVVGQPAENWAADDLEGQSHKLEDYRGKVVVLDFWYRGCGWCIRAMPQIKQLADDFRDQPVAVLGMNTDQNEDDAKFVVEKLGLNYTTLKIDRELAPKYGVQGFPTLIIIDQQGNVHDLHVGYSPTLRQEVGDVERALLAQK